MQEQFTSSYRDVDETKLLQVDNQYLSFCPRFILEALGLIALGSIGFYYKNNNLLDSQSLLSFLGVFNLLLKDFFSSSNNVLWLGNIMDISMISKILFIATLPANKRFKNFKDIEKFANSNITFKNVSYCYPGSTSFIFKNISLELPAGSVIGIKGSTGSGKSTFADLLMGLLQPTSGKILFGNTVINPPSTAHIESMWKAGLTHVPQKIFL